MIGRIFLLTSVLSAMSLPAQADVSVERGQMLFQTKCALCHNSDAAAGHAVGPNLHSVVGRQIGSAEGFNYSPALSDSKEHWTPELLDAFIESPATNRPGTAMPFSGLKKADDRKALILYLQSLGTQE
ncbi:TPA: c-type cytochrome [Pseudomonas aeruginosa]|nr:c-type cytochrome [Pseudomonas aeruginosa]